jgi:hypothetical protein
MRFDSVKIVLKLMQLKHPDAVAFGCPSCGERIPNFSVPISLGHDWNSVPRAPFHCPACRTLLCTSSVYRRSAEAVTTALAFFIPSALRIGPWYFWIGAVALSWVLLTLLSSVNVKVLFPPNILKYEGPPIPRILDNPDDLPINPWRKR